MTEFSGELPCTIEDVVDLLSIQPVKDRGTSFVCRCPFCDDRRGHFEVDRRKNLFHCYRCGTGGGVLHLYAYYYDVSLAAAGEELRKIFQSEQGREIRQSRVRREIIAPAEREIAPVEDRDWTYAHLLELLKLCPSHCAALAKRGLSEEEIASSGYRTTPAVRLARLVRQLQGQGCRLDGVPGFYREESNGEWMLDIRGSGIMLPDRNAEGQIEAIQIRLDVTRKSKFNNLTSAGKPSGVSAHCCPHFAGISRRAEMVLLTEGVMKSDIAHRFTKRLGREIGVVGLTGAGMKTQLRRALQELRELQIPKILLAYDMDYHTNDAVAMNRRYAIEEARAEGLDVVPLEWTQRYKGIDDVLLALLRCEDAVVWTPEE